MHRAGRDNDPRWVILATEAALIRLLLPVGSAKALALAFAANLASWLAGRALGY
jgi:hypothetical protein